MLFRARVRDDQSLLGIEFAPVAEVLLPEPLQPCLFSLRENLCN